MDLLSASRTPSEDPLEDGSQFNLMIAIRRPSTPTCLVARPIGIVSAVISSVSSSGACRSGAGAYRHSTAYGCSTINATAIDTTVVHANAANSNATNSNGSSVCEGVS